MTGIHLTAAGKAILRNGRFALTTPAAVAADSGTVTLTEALADTIYQRVGTSKAVPVAGTVTAADGPVEMRVINAKTSATVVDWATVGTSSGGAFAGTITVPQGCWYKLQARKVSNPGVVTTGARQFGVGKRIALIGQSNMAHMWEGEATYPLSDSRARRFSSGKWGYVGAADPTGTWAPGTPAFSGGGVTGYAGDATVNSSVNGLRGDGIVALVNAMTASLNGVPVGTFEYAVGGTYIDEWQTGGARWEAFATAMTAAGGDFEEAIWYQGENDAQMVPATYTTKVTNVLHQCWTLSGRNATNFAFGVVTLGPCDGAGGYGNFAAMRATQVAFAANTAGVYLASVAGDATVPSNDAVHLTPVPSLVRNGRRMSKASKAYASGTPKPGPRITGATRSGVRVTFTTAGGTGALNDGNGGTGAALKGARFFDAGAGNAQISTVGSGILSATIFYFDLASAPVGTLTADYGMADLPYGAYTPPAGAVLYDSDTVPGDTLGLPLQPCAAITVT